MFNSKLEQRINSLEEVVHGLVERLTNIDNRIDSLEQGVTVHDNMLQDFEKFKLDTTESISQFKEEIQELAEMVSDFEELEDIKGDIHDGPVFDFKQTLMPDGQLRLEMDWDDDFIVYARSQGCLGETEEQVVQHWLAKILKERTKNDKNLIA